MRHLPFEIIQGLFSSGGQSIGAWASALVLPMNIQGWFPLGLTSWSPSYPRDSQKSSPGPQFKSINSSVFSLLYGPMQKTLMLGKIEARRRRKWQRMRWLDSIMTQWMWVSVNPGRWWRTGKPGVLQSMGLQRVRHNLAIAQQQQSIVY